MICFSLLSLPLSFSPHHHILPSFSSIFHHYLQSCVTLYGVLLSFSNWSTYRHKACLFNLGSAEESERCKNNDLCLATNKKLASTSFLHLGANYVQVKRRNTSGGHKSPAEWRQGQAWRPDGRETTTLGPERVLLRQRRAEDGTALDP